MSRRLELESEITMRAIKLPAGTHPALATILRDMLALLPPSKLVRARVCEHIVERRDKSERIDALLNRAGKLLDAGEVETNPIAMMRLVDAAAACRLMAHELGGADDGTT